MEAGSESEKRVAVGGLPMEGDFARIYEEHSRPVYYFALRMLGNPAQAEDATHDVFLKAFRKLDTFRGDACIRTWLYRITINHCQNLMKSWYNRHVLPHAPEDLSLQGAGPCPGPSPLKVLQDKELGEQIQRTLDLLSQEYRLLLLLVADAKMSYEEIASLTNQSADAVRGKLHRARRAFAAHFYDSNEKRPDFEIAARRRPGPARG